MCFVALCLFTLCLIGLEGAKIDPREIQVNLQNIELNPEPPTDLTDMPLFGSMDDFQRVSMKRAYIFNPEEETDEEPNIAGLIRKEEGPIKCSLLIPYYCTDNGYPFYYHQGLQNNLQNPSTALRIFRRDIFSGSYSRSRTEQNIWQAGLLHLK
jgi:hypothetical protein